MNIGYEISKAWGGWGEDEHKNTILSSMYVDENRERFTIYHAIIILNVKFYIGNKVEENIRKFDRLWKEMENDWRRRIRDGKVEEKTIT